MGWLFYKGYYANVTDDDYIFMLLSKEERREREKEEEALEKKISKNVQNVIDVEVSIEDNQSLGNAHFKATTTYPGLLLGTGIDHELPSVNNQAILGFTFDYTTGLPSIPASSVKGVLRSAFKHADYIQFLLDDETFDVKKLELEIFGQENGSKNISQGQDVFFDSKVISSGKILGDDYLAPHGEDALKNPVPLRFIKVLSNVEFLFDFELSDGVLSKEEKIQLFIHILSDLGMGAKTNVGYGRFSNIQMFETEEEKQQKEQDKQKKEAEKLAKMSPIDRVFEAYENDLPKVILAMQSGEIDEYESIKTELAQKVKEELQKEPKTWERAKQKALKRKEFIEAILK